MSKTHEYTLYKGPMNSFQIKGKKVEMRLYDEKRRMIEVGDRIRFTCVDDESLWILCEVKGLRRFPSFKELYDSYPKEDLGYGEDEEASFEDMYGYYSKKRIQKYGAFAIEIAVLETSQNK